MPIYRYRNLNTNETFDLEQRITESALSVHPETGDPVKRLIQPVGIAFKGSGFYVNDSRSSGGAAKPGATKTEGKGEGSSTETKSGDGKSDKTDNNSDSKSEKKPEKAASAG